jgi:hypothetical protein
MESSLGRGFWLGLVLLMVTASAFAQQQSQPVDPRIAGPMIEAQKAEISLRDAALMAVQEDAKRRETEWHDWFKAWCGDTPGCVPVKVGQQ